VGCGAGLFISVGGAGCVPLSGQGLPRLPVWLPVAPGAQALPEAGLAPPRDVLPGKPGRPPLRGGEAEAPRAEAYGEEGRGRHS